MDDTHAIAPDTTDGGTIPGVPLWKDAPRGILRGFAPSRELGFHKADDLFYPSQMAYISAVSAFKQVNWLTNRCQMVSM